MYESHGKVKVRLLLMLVSLFMETFWSSYRKDGDNLLEDVHVILPLCHRMALWAHELTGGRASCASSIVPQCWRTFCIHF